MGVIILLAAIGEVLHVDIAAPERRLLAFGDGRLDLLGRNLYGEYPFCNRTLEDVGVDEKLGVDVCHLVVGIGAAGIGLHAQLEGAVVLTEGESRGVNVYPLSEMVVGIHGTAADLDIQNTGAVLDVELAVHIAGTVGRDDLTLDPYALLYLYGCLGRGVHGLELGDGVRDAGIVVHQDLVGGFLGAAENRLPFLNQTLAGNEGREGRECNDDLLHNLRI